MTMNVDEYVESKVQPEFRKIVALIRQAMRELAPQAHEEIRYGMPVYKGKSLFAWINPPKKDVKLSFTRGKQLEDSYGLLKGTAKGSRYLRFKNTAEVKKEVLEYYVKQALVLDAK